MGFLFLRPFRSFFSGWGDFPGKWCGVFFATFGGKHGFLLAVLVLLQDGEDRDSSDAFGAETRLLDQAPEWLGQRFFFSARCWNSFSEMK